MVSEPPGNVQVRINVGHPRVLINEGSKLVAAYQAAANGDAIGVVRCTAKDCSKALWVAHQSRPKLSFQDGQE